jgi:hypothetical protein
MGAPTSERSGVMGTVPQTRQSTWAQDHLSHTCIDMNPSSTLLVFLAETKMPKSKIKTQNVMSSMRTGSAPSTPALRSSLPVATFRGSYYEYSYTAGEILP